MGKKNSGKVEIEYLPLSRLKRWPRNPKDHDLGTLHQSISRFGFVSPIIIDERTGQLVAGHGRLDALQQMKATGQKPPQRVISRNGEWLVPVIRGVAFKDAVEAEAYALADNRLVEAGGWDEQALATVLSDLAAQDALQGIGWDADQVDDLLRDLGRIEAKEAPEPDWGRAKELRKKWGVKLGQIWQIGKHRLMCGDTRDFTQLCNLIDKKAPDLVIADPPYGVDYASKNKFLNTIARGNRIQESIRGDDRAAEQVAETLWGPAFRNLYETAREGTVLYSFAPQGGDQMMMMMIRANFNPTMHQLIWVKNNHVLGRVDYAYQHEPIIYTWKDGKHKFYGPFQTSILHFDRQQINDLHPTMKPLSLIQRLIENSSRFEELVLDPFLGSGTTMIAAEQLSRICYGMEIEPKYVAVALQRLADMGLEPRLADG